MNINEVLASAKDSITVKRVFAEPIERDGATVILAARVMGGGGGGSGQEEGEGGPQGEGGGFGLHASPAGAFVIKNGDVTWRPAVDANRVVAAVAAVAIAVVLTRRAWRARRDD